MPIQALMNPRTTENGPSHLSASHSVESLLKRSFPASHLINPSVETTKGVKCLKRCSRQGCKYFFFFSCSCVARTLWGSHEWYDFVSVSATWKSQLSSVPWAQKPRMSESPCSSSFITRMGQALDWWLGVGALLVSSAVHLEWIIGSTHTAEGASALDAKSRSSLLISLCHRIMRPPILHLRV
jgi:hypothetical protein